MNIFFFYINSIPYRIRNMNEIIEIKRKEFTVTSIINETCKIVERKGEQYLLKDFSNDVKGFNEYVESEHKLRTSGINIPKLYLYDKNKHLVVMDYIDGETVLEMLQDEPLPDIIFEQIFLMNFRMKVNKIKIDFDPLNFRVKNGKLYYLSSFCRKFDENSSFEKSAIFLWFYTKELVAYLSSKGLPVNQNRINKISGETNKQIALMTIKYYK